MIHRTAQVHPTAVIYPGVSIGPGARIGAYAVIGGPPEHRLYFDGRLPTYGVEVREGARIFEFVTIHAGIARPTEIGQDAAVFNHSHVGHDAVLERGSIIGGHCALAGHVHVMHQAQISGKSCVRHRVVVGAYGFLGANSFLTSHLPPGELWNGSPARRNGNNEVGLERAALTYSEANDLFLPAFENLIERAPL